MFLTKQELVQLTGAAAVSARRPGSPQMDTASTSGQTVELHRNLTRGLYSVLTQATCDKRPRQDNKMASNPGSTVDANIC